MKNIILSLILIFTISVANSYGQEVTMNETLKIYEYTNVKEFVGGIEDRLELFVEKMQELNYQVDEKADDGIKGENFFTKMILGSAMEVHYNALVKFKGGRYKLTINSFRIKVVRYGTVAVETLRKGSQKK